MILTETPRRQLITKLVSWGHWFALANIVIAIVIAGIYLFSSSLPNSLLGLAYLFSNWFSHIGFLTFMSFVIFILPLCYIIPNSKFMRAYASVIAAVGLALLAFDALLYTRHGLHLSITSVELVRQQTSHVIANFSWRQWSFLLVLFVVWLLFQLLLANSLWKRIERFQKLKVGTAISSVFVGLFIFSHATHIWADAKLYEPIVKQDDLFPLSYPATAKTLMSKYGLLDIQDYKNKRALKFEHLFDQVNYPKEPLYCTVDSNKKVVVLFSTELGDLHNSNVVQNLSLLKQHYDLSLNSQSTTKTMLYGLPDIYHREVSKVSPLLLDIPRKLGMDVDFYSSEDVELNGAVNNSWEAFSQSMLSAKAGLFIGIVTQSQISQLSTQVIEDAAVFISEIKANSQVMAYSNFINQDNILSSHQDISATVLAEIGCDLPVDKHSTGQNLKDLSRSWLVTTQQDKIVVLSPTTRTEVERNGNYRVFDMNGNQLNNEELNVALLGQGIKLLSSFTDGK